MADTLPKIMTMEEIEALCDGEWVLIEDPEADEQLNVKSGKLLWHSKDREEVIAKMLELRPKSCTIQYAGQLTYTYDKFFLV